MQANRTLSAFIGRSFLTEDKEVWYELRDILDSFKPMGFEYEDAAEGQIRPISEKIKEKILEHEIYIGVLTKRFAIWESPATFYEKWVCRRGTYKPKRWTTSEWVTEEIGFAIGKDRKILLLIEQGVHFPVTDLDGDTQFVGFDRENLANSQNEIGEMLLNIISQRVKPITESLPATQPPSTEPKSEETIQTEKIIGMIADVIEQAAKYNFSEADKIQKTILEEATEENREAIECYLLNERARNSDTNSLQKLKLKCAEDPTNYEAVKWLARVYSAFGEHEEAIELLQSHAPDISPSSQHSLTIETAKELCAASKTDRAIELLIRAVQKAEEGNVTALYLEIARSAQTVANFDIEIAFLEKYIREVPTDNKERFRLAYLYSNTDQHQASAYHYNLVYNHTDWVGVRNNLAIAYGHLDLKAKEYSLYKEVMDSYSLAKANLAMSYAQSGDLGQAEILAKSALSMNGSDEEIAHKKARDTMDEIENTTKKENELIEKIPQKTETLRDFMAEYAEGICATPLTNGWGVFSTPYGTIELSWSEGRLNGKGVNEPLGQTSNKATTLGLLAAGLSSTGSTLTMIGELTGQSGSFELTIAPTEKPTTILGDTTRIIKGLANIKNDGEAIILLERDRGESRLTTASRKQS
jgi:thioredoxin-like negative regulator of GroEL